MPARRIGRSKKRCEHSGKVRFRDEKSAKMSMSNARRLNPDSAKQPVRAYLCPDCMGWHLTSKE